MEERGVIEVKVSFTLFCNPVRNQILGLRQWFNSNGNKQKINFFQGKGEMQTYWLLDADRNAKKAKKEPAKEEPKNWKRISNKMKIVVKWVVDLMMIAMLYKNYESLIDTSGKIWKDFTSGDIFAKMIFSIFVNYL